MIFFGNKQFITSNVIVTTGTAWKGGLL
jgi:hypothetical protein